MQAQGERVMKITWKKKGEERGKKRPQSSPILLNPNFPFAAEDDEGEEEKATTTTSGAGEEIKEQQQNRQKQRQMAESFRLHGNKLAEEGKYGEALGKWEAALTLVPANAILHEQKAQVLLEIGDAWAALKAATRATELESSWAEAWITLARAQLNFGEPDAAIVSFDRALSIKPDLEDAKSDKETALRLVKRRKQLHSSGMCTTEGRFLVKDKSIS